VLLQRRRQGQLVWHWTGLKERAAPARSHTAQRFVAAPGRAASNFGKFDKLRCRDVAVIVGCSERGIETRLSLARVRLRSSLGSWWEEILCEIRAIEASAAAAPPRHRLEQNLDALLFDTAVK
jgi:hypothetical protein